MKPYLIVVDNPTRSEAKSGTLLTGNSGKEFDKMLHEAGVLRSDCEVVSVVNTPYSSQGDHTEFFLKYTPGSKFPGIELNEGVTRLDALIEELDPKVIITLGELSLWAVTGKSSITKWRGSMIQQGDRWVIPTFSPVLIQRKWDWRFQSIMDLRRARQQYVDPVSYPAYDFLIRPGFDDALRLIQTLPSGRVACDIETRGGHLACIGFATSPLSAFCIPLMCIEREDGYWSEEEEYALVMAMRLAFKRSDIHWTFQNGIYDVQYIARFWGVVPNVSDDTMLGHHVFLPGTPKGLDFLSSAYCKFHLYWKDEGKEWDAKTGEDQLWEYNCKDAVATWEAMGQIEEELKSANLYSQYRFQMQHFYAVLRMMMRGVKCDKKFKLDMVFTLQEAMRETQRWIDTAVGRPLNLRSPKQISEFFYNELGMKPVRHHKTRRITTDENALLVIAQRQPVLKPLVDKMLQLRSLGVFCSTYAMMGLDIDGKLRCSYNVAGTETFRLSSSGNAFGSGGNLQNIPQEGSGVVEVKCMFIPDNGHDIAEGDLQRADAQVVAWEAHDEILKQMFREDVDIHTENAKVIFGNERLTASSPERQLAKVGVHATDYYAKPPTLARALGITVHAAHKFQKAWFAAHPGISDWHDRIQDSINTTRSVVNRFGFRRYYFDRIEGILPEALAWIPQSTVALVIAVGLVRMNESTHLQPLLQVHDSLVFQYPSYMGRAALRDARENMLVEIPYDDPLIIPVDFKVSDKSWGDAKKVKLEG